MLRNTDSSIRRHPDGSLDIAFYGSRALRLRRSARTDAVKRIGAAVKASLARLRGRASARFAGPFIATVKAKPSRD